MSDIRKYLPHYTPGGVPEYRDGSVFTTTIPLATMEVTEPGPSWDQVGTKSGPSRDQVEILNKCTEERTLVELMVIFGRSNRTKFRNEFVKPLIEMNLIRMTIPNKTRSSKQKYVITENGKLLLEGAGQDD